MHNQRECLLHVFEFASLDIFHLTHVFLKFFLSDGDESLDNNRKNEIHKEEGPHDYDNYSIENAKEWLFYVHQVVHIGAPRLCRHDLEYDQERTSYVIETVDSIVHVRLQNRLLTLESNVEIVRIPTIAICWTNEISVT